MPANAIISNTETADRGAVSLVAVIGDLSGPHWICEQVRLQDGASPAYALAKIPMKALDSTAPAVAAVSGSPMEGIKQGSAATVTAVSAGTGMMTILTGIVTSISQRWSDGEDHLIVRIEDYREYMRKWPIIGSFWANDDPDDGGIAYRQGWKFRTNPNGAPNCIWRTAEGLDGYVPVMCSPWHGVTADTDPPLDTVESQDQACYWTADSVLQYLRYCTTLKALAVANGAGFQAYPIWHEAQITWPAGFANGVRAYANTQTIKDRKADDYTYERSTMLGAVQRVLEMAGPYSLNMNTATEKDDAGRDVVKGVMSIVRTKYDKDGVVLMRPMGGAAVTQFAKPRVVVAGSLNESSANLYTKLVAAGDLVFIERRVWMTTAGTGTLRKAWDAAAETAFKDYVQTGVNSRSLTLANAIQEAMRKYPQVGAAYYIDHSYDFQSGTSQSAYGRATTPRPILDTLLSNYWEGQDTAPAADQQRRYRRPILFEYQSHSADPEAGTWYLANMSDGLTLDADGTIWLPGLRPGYTIVATQAGTAPSAVVTIAYNKLRATVAIPCDHRLTAARKLASEGGALQVASTKSLDASRIEDELDFTLYEGQGDGDYALEERKLAYPIPQTITGATVQTGVIRTDADLLANHVERRAADFGRLERSGEFIMANLLTTLRPGMQIAALDNNGGGDENSEAGQYRLGVVVRAVTLNNQNQNGNGGPGIPGQYASVEVV